MSKNSRKLICAILIISFVFCFLPQTFADAVVFFSDVSKNDYFYTEVAEMSRTGVVSGYGDGSFLPQNPVKHAEAIKLVCSMAKINYAGYSGKTSPWYSDVWKWAQDRGIVSSGTDPNAYATRENICSYIAGIYKLDVSKTISNVFSDTDSKIANTLYDYGIIKGIPNEDGTVSFGGSQNVKRCDTCIMLYRLNEKVSLPNWSESFLLDKSHYSVSRPASFANFDDYANAWSYMLVNKVLKDSFQIKLTCTKAQLEELSEDIQLAYIFAALDYMEYASFLDQWGVEASYSIDRSGNCINPMFTLTLSNSFGLPEQELKSQITSFENTCDQIVTKLYAQGSLSANMSVRQKALVLYKYVAFNTKYDTGHNYYNGYDAAVRRTAVCQGYTAMYNYLCNIAGVPMECMTGTVGEDAHAWSCIYIDGTRYNIDCTWGDPIPDRPNYCDETWFWVTDSFLKTGNNSRTFDFDIPA